MKRGFRDRDYLETIEGLLFCVLDSVHPGDRVIAYLKYVPSSSGKWGKGNKRMKRILKNYTMQNLLETFEFLERNYPEYLYHSSVMNIKMSAVPLNRISQHFKPEEKMMQLLDMEKPDNLQRKVIDLAQLLSDKSGVPLELLGVTGSILLDIHQDFSDIDMIVYGAEASRSVKDTLIQLYKNRDSPIRRFRKKMIHEWCLNKAKTYPLTYEEAARIFKKRWNRGVFQGTLFSIHSVKLEEEVNERYGDRIFKPEGMIEIKARVSDASEADFLPAVYKVTDVKIIEGRRVNDINEVVSYEGLYGSLAEEGERILSYGKLERVIDRKTGEEYHRVLVGSKEAGGGDYIKPLD